jgi:hypothetical protein
VGSKIVSPNSIRYNSPMRAKEIDMQLKFSRYNARIGAFNEWSRVDSGKKPWPVYDETIESYTGTFASVLETGDFLTEIEAIKNARELGNSRFTGLEVMGPGSRLFGDFPPGLFTQTGGLTVIDHRNDAQKQKDTHRNHQVIPLDVNDSGLGTVLDTAFAGNPLDIIIFRPHGGLYDVVNNAYALFEQVQTYYSKLATEGTLFAQVPLQFRPFRNQWLRHMQGYPGLAIKWPKESILRLDKGIGAPQSLDGLSPKIIQTNKDYQTVVNNINLMNNF